jgi:hypothetical protein
MSSLPTKTTSTDRKVVQFFDSYFSKPLEFAASDFDATVGFFTQRNFEESAARTISQVLLNQAKLEGVKIFQLLDTLKLLPNNQLSFIITKILNSSRDKTSQLGYQSPVTDKLFELRNINDPIMTGINEFIVPDEEEIINKNYVNFDYVEPGYVE